MKKMTQLIKSMKAGARCGELNTSPVTQQRGVSSSRRRGHRRQVTSFINGPAWRLCADVFIVFIWGQTRHLVTQTTSVSYFLSCCLTAFWRRAFSSLSNKAFFCVWIKKNGDMSQKQVKTLIATSSRSGRDALESGVNGLNPSKVPYYSCVLCFLSWAWMEQLQKVFIFYPLFTASCLNDR